MPPWDEVVRANSERLKAPALTQSPRQEGGEWCRQTNPIEFEARGTALSAILLSSDLFRKDFLCSAATGGAGSALSQTTGSPPTPAHAGSNSSKISGNHSVKAWRC